MHWAPDWSAASLRFDTRVLSLPQGTHLSCDVSCRPEDLRVLRYFSVRPSADVTPGGQWLEKPPYHYEFLAYFDSGLRQPPPQPLASTEWWRSLEKLPIEKLFTKTSLEALKVAGRSIVVGQAPLLQVVALNQPESNDRGSIHGWLRFDLAARQIFEMPQLHEHWSLVANKTLAEAITFMEAEQRKIHDVRLLGVTVPGELCLAAIPLAFLLAHLLLFIHLRSCVSVLAMQLDRDEIKEHFPWMGLYREHLAQITTALSVTLIPALSIVSLVIRFRARADVSVIATACVLGGVAIALGCLASREIRKLRQEYAL